jgi:hypothetical protein
MSTVLRFNEAIIINLAYPLVFVFPVSTNFQRKADSLT